MPSTDRNAKDSFRLRRNAQRTRAGAITGDIKLDPTGGLQNGVNGIGIGPYVKITMTNDYKGFTIIGVASQTTDYFEVSNFDGDILVVMDSSGSITLSRSLLIIGGLTVFGATSQFSHDVGVGGVFTLTGSLDVPEGADAMMGAAVLVGGTVTISNTRVTANSRILVSIQSLGTVAVPQAVGVTARVVGTSFTITSANVTDTSTVAWLIVEPA